MKKLFNKINLLLALLLIVGLASAKEIVIYHTSDTHGHYYSKYAGWDEKNYDRKIGGFAVLKNLLDLEKNPYLLLDSGDFTRGSIEDDESKGKYAIEFMNKVGYDASVIGNHEFDYGIDNLKKRISMAKFDILSSNILDENGKHPKHVKPYKIYKVGGFKIAVIGVGRGYKSLEKWQYKTAEEGIRSVIEKASKKADAVIVLSHSSAKRDDMIGDNNMDTAEKFKNEILLYLGGHYHAEIQNYYNTKSWPMFVESGAYFNNVSRVVIDIDPKTKNIKKMKSELIPLWVDVYGENIEILAFGDKFRNKQADIVIGKSKNPIRKQPNLDKEPKFMDSPLGSAVSDIMREYAGTQIAIQNLGGVRSDLGMGNIAYRDIYNVFPFPNTLAYLNVDGKFLKELFEFAVRDNGSWLQVAGAEVVYKYENNKAKELQIFVDGKLVKPEDKFTLVTNDYIAKGGSEGKLFKDIEHKVITEISVRDVIINYIKEKQEISAPKPGRIRIK